MYKTALTVLMPEMILATMACVILLLDCFFNKLRATMSYIAGLTAIVMVAACIFMTFNLPSIAVFENAFIFDAAGQLLKLILFALLAIAFVYSRLYVRTRGFFQGDFFALMLFSVLGMMLLISSGNFLTLYLGLELFALPLYALITISKGNKIYSEAAIKYFIMGALASGLLLYGVSLIYGVTGSFDFNAVTKEFITQSTGPQVALDFGMIFVLAGLAFKLGAVPFHMWLPDVYEGSPTAITLFIGTLPKLAAFGMAYRLLSQVFANMHEQWQLLFMGMAILSLAIGNVVAIAQKNIKRMLAYSTISHVGFMLLGFIAAPSQGYSAAMFYTVTYSIMAMGAFGIIILLSKQAFESDQIEDFKGLGTSNPWLAFFMMIIMFSMAGIPPTVGFYAKFFVLQAVIQSGHVGLAIIALLFSVIGAFYYLRIIKVMYFDSPVTAQYADKNGMTWAGKIVIGFNSLLLILFGVYPAPLLYMCLFSLNN